MAGAENSPKTFERSSSFFLIQKSVISWGNGNVREKSMKPRMVAVYFKNIIPSPVRQRIAELPGRRDYGAMVHHLSKAGGGDF